MIEIERRLHLLAEPRARIVGDAHVLLFEHDLELGLDHVLGEHEPGHAVGLELHQHLEMLARGALEIAGVVARREGVLLAADGRDRLGELALRVILRALEHQMFEEMGEPGLAGGLVGGADPVPDHVGDDRRAVVGDDHHFEAVGEREMGDVRTRRGFGDAAACRRARPRPRRMCCIATTARARLFI